MAGAVRPQTDELIWSFSPSLGTQPVEFGTLPSPGGFFERHCPSPLLSILPIGPASPNFLSPGVSIDDGLSSPSFGADGLFRSVFSDTISFESSFAIEQPSKPHPTSVAHVKPATISSAPNHSFSDLQALMASLPESMVKPDRQRKPTISQKGQEKSSSAPLQDTCSVSSVSTSPTGKKQSKPTSRSIHAVAAESAIEKAAERRRRNRESSSRCYYNRKRIIDALDAQISSEKQRLTKLYDRALEMRHENARLKRNVVLFGIPLPLSKHTPFAPCPDSAA